MIKCGIFIDGFNLYHSLRDAITKTTYSRVRWLDISSLCDHFMKEPARCFLSESLSRECIHFFSAKPMHAYPDTRKRFDLYMNCLRNTGIEVHLGNYRRRTAKCKLCKGEYSYHEEKETDVAIGVGILQKAIEHDLGAVIVVSGDADLIPAYSALKEMRPETIRIVALPFKRSLNVVKKSVDHYFNIKPKIYAMHQFDDPLVLSNGTTVSKPPTW
ncbi:MAG: NYN domain-containing protein [Candidatus Aegiribacteria sp.]|nr:NYN domain-containing protein [Candidatus Aegiribacteria sp.]